MVAKIGQKPARTFLALAVASSLVAAGCATVVRAASAGVEAGTEHRLVVNDPDNPYWIGATRIDDAVGASKVQVVNDPDNPYWIGSAAATRLAAPNSSYAEPFRGPR